MSANETTPKDSPSQQPVAGLLAEFDGVKVLKRAAARVRDEGFTRWDVHSPFPVHGIERAMGMRPTVLPWLVLGAGIAGGAVALLMQWWMNAVSYPLIISGKPLFSLPANIPVTFEVIVLFSALAAFFGALVLNRLPQFTHPVIGSKRFHRATSDGFFISIDAADPNFDDAATRELLESLGPAGVETCYEAAGGGKFPKALVWSVIFAVVLAPLPPLLIARMRQIKSESPPIHIIQDMDLQSKYPPQAASPLFDDGRAMRPPVAGTIAVGGLRDDEHFYAGYRNRQQEGDQPKEPEYFTTFPVQVTERPDELDDLIERGRQRYDIFCAPCHGLIGDSRGTVALRAARGNHPNWATPTSLHSGDVRKISPGKLFATITDPGQIPSRTVRKMPAYGPQIPAMDRWAIVLYVRALQRSQHADAADFADATHTVDMPLDNRSESP